MTHPNPAIAITVNGTAFNSDEDAVRAKMTGRQLSALVNITAPVSVTLDGAVVSLTEAAPVVNGSAYLAK